MTGLAFPTYLQSARPWGLSHANVPPARLSVDALMAAGGILLASLSLVLGQPVANLPD